MKKRPRLSKVQALMGPRSPEDHFHFAFHAARQSLPEGTPFVLIVQGEDSQTRTASNLPKPEAAAIVQHALALVSEKSDKYRVALK